MTETGPSPAVGLDLEELAALEGTAAPALEAFGHRWLSAGEREWCGRQPRPARAMAIVHACREAVAKAVGSGPVSLTGLDVAPALVGERATLVVTAPEGRYAVRLSWSATSCLVAAVALAWPADP